MWGEMFRQQRFNLCCRVQMIWTHEVSIFASHLLRMKKACGSTSSKDRISHLPEPLRTKIISFLPIEDAIRTSILSSLWRYITAYLVNLEFNQKSFEEKNYNEDQFRIFVDRLLVSLDRIDIRRFSLFLDVKDDSFFLQIRAWILFALRNNVREFNLHHDIECYRSSSVNLKFPSCFFQCRTITEMSLAGLYLNVPTNVWFPSLKRFKLHSVIVYYCKSTDPDIFSFCPVLESIIITYCTEYYWRRKSKRLRRSTEIKIHAKNLKQIEYRGFELPTMSHATLSSLSRVSLTLEYPSNIVDWSKTSPLIGLRKVERLSLLGEYIEVISRNPESLACISTCSSLKHLELEISPLWEQVNIVIIFLNNYTNLVTLCVSVQTTSEPTNKANLQMDSQRTISRHLKTVELENFGGRKEELHIVRYLLENASDLEKMKINYLYALKNDATTRLMVSEELLTITKASARATIFFS